MALSCNVGGTDRAVRILLTVVFVALGVWADTTGHGTWALPSFLLALVASLTAFIGYCPLNNLLGLNTCK